MGRWLRWALGVIAPIVGIFAGVMTREWRDDILGAFPFVVGNGPVVWRAVAFWLLVSVPVAFAAWSFLHARRQEVAGDKREAAHAGALGLSLSRAGETSGLWITNRGTHVITDIRVVATPDEWASVELPLVSGGAADAQLMYPMAGGWFFASVLQLSPGRGLLLCAVAFAATDFTRIAFDCSWLDHDGKQRKSYALADLRSVDGEIGLRPRPESPMT